MSQDEPTSIADAIGGSTYTAALFETNISAPCVKCGTVVEGISKFASGAIHCDECYPVACRKLVMEEYRKRWLRFCPPMYQSTDLESDEFNKAAWAHVKAVPLDKSLVFVGASGQCKTRIMMERLKRCLIAGKPVDVLWADKLDEIIESRKTAKAMQQYADVPVLGIDDFGTSGSAYESVSKFLKGLIDRRMREGRTTIITTNLRGRDVTQDADKFGNSTKADKERTLAIVRRLRDSSAYRTIDFDQQAGGGRF
jgi:hypothetical protein